MFNRPTSPHPPYIQSWQKLEESWVLVKETNKKFGFPGSLSYIYGVNEKGYEKEKVHKNTIEKRPNRNGS